jgi:peptide subunit release factor 1 (eRF1)
MQRVRELAGQRHQPAVTSVYLDVDGRRNPRPIDVERHFKDMRKEIEERLEAEGPKPPHAYRMSVRGDLERMQRFVAEDFERQGPTRGLALFSCSHDRWFEVVEVPFDVHDQAALDERPRVRQLELVLAEQRVFGVVLVDRRRLRVFRASPDGFEALAERFEFVGSRHERGGWSGPGVQRHADEISRRHFREFGEAVHEVFRKHPVDEVLVGATEEDLAEFRVDLHPHVAERITATITATTSTPLEEVREEVAQVAEQRIEERRNAVLQRFTEAAAGAEPAATGLQQVVDALNEKRVEVLLVDSRLTASGRRCPRDDTLSLDARECPACGTAMVDVEDMVDEAATRALDLDAPVYSVPDDRLQRFGQIGAILRW